MTPPTFATPLPQSQHSNILEWRFPKPYQHLVLTGRSRAAWHTSFIIPQLDLLLDAGLCVNNLRPTHIFLTHGHSDHVLVIPSFTRRENRPDIYCPEEMKNALDAYLNANIWLNQGGGAWPPQGEGSDGEGDDDDEDDEGQEESTKKEEQKPLPAPNEPNPSEAPPASSEEATTTSTTNPIPSHPANPAFPFPHLRLTHITHGLRAGATVPLARLTGPPTWTATAFRCDHTVPCLGYVFSATTPKLRPELRGLPPAELKAFREKMQKEQGPSFSMTVPVSTPVFAFLGDTTASVLASGPEWLGEAPPPREEVGEEEEEGQGNSAEENKGGNKKIKKKEEETGSSGVKVVITECSFLYPEHRKQAAKTKHTCWQDLEPVVRKWWKTTFVLCHFSLRYSDEDIRKFFADKKGLENVVVWIGDKS